MNLDLAHQAANDKAFRTLKDKKLHGAAFKQHGYGDKPAPVARKRSKSSLQPHMSDTSSRDWADRREGRQRSMANQVKRQGTVKSGPRSKGPTRILCNL